MIVVTKRRKIGAICCHDIYAVTSTKMIPVPHPCVQSNLAHCKDEQRYKKLFHSVDLKKDFFFSNTYHIMWSLQKNSRNSFRGQVPFESMFVWNEYLTRGIRHALKNSNWVVALVYGFFKQERLSICDKTFIFTLIARRSKHYAGTRFLKRGVNDKGRVANDVETEQIVFEDASDRCVSQTCSIVQHRGSIPLYWSQEISILNLKPDIIVQGKDPTYQATRLHFENLMKRYGTPIIVLNLIKGCEKKPRESILCAEYAKAVELINETLPEGSRLKFIHMDIHKLFRSKSANVLEQLKRLAIELVNLTGFYYNAIESDSKMQNASLKDELEHDIEKNPVMNRSSAKIHACDDNKLCTTDNLKILKKRPSYQSGVLRTNCIDCIDRTNVAQYAYGLAALGQQLHALELTEVPDIDLDSSLAEELMGLYEMMGDTLALQYGGSTAHNKVFSERRGQSRAAMNSQEIFRSLKRFYSNVYLDAEKQNAINVFLGHYQPQEGKPALWELQSDQNYTAGSSYHGHLIHDSGGPFIRSLSDGNILMKQFASNLQAKEKRSKGKTSLVGSLEEEASSSSCDSTPTNPRVSANGPFFSRFMTASLVRGGSSGSDINSTVMENDETKSEFNQDSEITISESNVIDRVDGSSLSLSAQQGIQESSTLEADPADSGSGCLKNFAEWGIEGKTLTELGSACKEICQSCCLKGAPPPEFSNEFSSSFIHWVCHGQTLCH
eukprot:TRINITY_DN1585_c0_g1_i1.p1 TRINITY_DN1585_c0_g1~~TRINITY_DN1585_c0_g1_i1.p1  ORF type:complete len:724 (-),score=140.02 TRINITY_DN1585_c0_g1_i1:193-2364(-)